MKHIFLLGLVLSTMACNRQSQQEIQITKKQNANLTALHVAYGLKESASPDIPSLKKALSGGRIYRQIKGDLDFDKVQLLTSIKENVLIYIIPLMQKNRYYAVKATKAKTLLVQDELLVVSKMQDDKNGTTGILKNSEALQIEFMDGRPIIKNISIHEYKAHFMQDWENMDPAQVGFCQRQSGQSYGDCFKHEVDEFCDSFISCLALSHPGVQIMIGLACSCNARSETIVLPKPAEEKIIQPVEPNAPLDGI